MTNPLKMAMDKEYLPACDCDDMAEANIRLRRQLKELQSAYAQLCAENIELRTQLKKCDIVYKPTNLRRVKNGTTHGD